MLNILCIPAEIDAYLARSESLKTEWDQQAAEFEEALAAYEATFGLASWVEEEGPMPSPLMASPGVEEPTTSSRTSKCPRGIGVAQDVLNKACVLRLMK